MIKVDQFQHNADWTKQTWDLLNIKSPEDLLEYLKSRKMTLGHFKKLPIYYLNKNKIKWLKDL